MAGPLLSDHGSASSEDEQPCAVTDPDRLEAEAAVAAMQLDWQGELDSALDSIDARLVRRRWAAGSAPASPTARPEFRDLPLTSEIVDELASRVAARLKAADRRRGVEPGGTGLPVGTTATLVDQPFDSEKNARPRRRIGSASMVSIRIRWPLFASRRRRR